MKRIISAVLSAVLISVLLTGCGESETGTRPEESVQTEEAGWSEETAQTEEPVQAEEDVQSEESGSPADEDLGEIMGLVAADLDKNDVRLGDMISGNKLTMINYWGTFCGPCIGEMPYLAELEKEYKDQGFEIIGLTCDIALPDGSYDDEAIEDARDIMNSTGVDYPILIATEEINDFINSEYVPCTFFVDSNGNRIGDEIVGSQEKDDWEQTIKDKLSSVQD